MNRLEEIKEREAKASPGPWRAAEKASPDAIFLAYARMDIPWLLDEVERLRNENSLLFRDLRRIERDNRHERQASTRYFEAMIRTQQETSQLLKERG